MHACNTRRPAGAAPARPASAQSNQDAIPPIQKIWVTVVRRVQKAPLELNLKSYFQRAHSPFRCGISGLEEVGVAQVERPRDAARRPAAAAAAPAVARPLLVLSRDAEPDEETDGEGEDGRHDDAQRERLLRVEQGRSLGERQRRHEGRPREVVVAVAAAAVSVVVDEIADGLLALVVVSRANWNGIVKMNRRLAAVFNGTNSTLDSKPQNFVRRRSAKFLSLCLPTAAPRTVFANSHHSKLAARNSPSFTEGALHGQLERSSFWPFWHDCSLLRSPRLFCSSPRRSRSGARDDLVGSRLPVVRNGQMDTIPMMPRSPKGLCLEREIKGDEITPSYCRLFCFHFRSRQSQTLSCCPLARASNRPINLNGALTGASFTAVECFITYCRQ